MEYDPNPLLSLSKRKRRTSSSVSTEEKQSPEVQKQVHDISYCEPSSSTAQPAASDTEHCKEKKRLKKKKKEKLKEEDRKKKKKHKCPDEVCTHKKHHKKHKKHRKHHDKSPKNARPCDDIFYRNYTCKIIEEDPSTEDEEEVQVTGADIETPVIPEKIDNDDSSVQSSIADLSLAHSSPNTHAEATRDDSQSSSGSSSKSFRDRQESCESRSKMNAFLHSVQLWHWSGNCYKTSRAKGKSKKFFYKSIQRGKEYISIGDAAVFLSTSKPDRPYIGKIEAMWEASGSMVVKVKWFYHPEETVGCPENLKYPGALFESNHIDENDVQTISHRCEVLPLSEYNDRLGLDMAGYASIYENNDLYYLAGHYHPVTQTIDMKPGIPFTN